MWESFARNNSFPNMNPVDRESTTCCKDEKVSEPEDLLDESWFFGNLLHTKSRMSRCYSDPCPSSNYYSEQMSAGKSLEETYSSLQKLPAEGEDLTRSPAGLVRTPSLPEESSSQSGRRSHRLHGGNATTHHVQTSVNNLSRAPSLPSSIGREEIQDEESDFSMSRLIRQASLKHPENTLPPKHLPKGVVQGSSSSTPRNRPRRKPDLECISPESPEGMMMIRRQNPISRSKLTKSTSDLAFQELHGLRDLSINYEKPELSPQEKKQQQIGGEEKMKRSPSFETWQVQKQSLDYGKRSVEDMKAQIRFWARAVASNVR